jgi:hypothetical protein
MNSTSRGLRNNNPGNIDRSPNNKWQGRMPREQMTVAQRDEKRFEVFASPPWGIRAICVLLISYQDRHGITNVQGFIHRWAPPVENDTGAYVNRVAKAVGVKPDAYINIHEYRRMRPMVEAIIRHENGVQPYSADVIEEGLRLAGIVKPGGAALVATPKAATAATATAVAAGGGAALVELSTQLTPAVQQFLPAVQTANTPAQSTQALPDWARAAVALAVAISVGASVYAWWRLRRAQRAVQP